MKASKFAVMILAILAILAFCESAVSVSSTLFESLTSEAPEMGTIGMADPACVYCEALGYKCEDGNCIFPDGTSVSAWEFYRGEAGRNFSFCELQGYRIENRVEDMGTFTVKYAACIFNDSSECLEQDYFDGECGPSDCSRWTMKDGCHLAVDDSGLISKTARINNSAGQSAEDVMGWDVVYMGEDGKCYSYYVAQAPLEGMTEPEEVECPDGVRTFDSYTLDFEDAIAAMKSMRCGSTFVELSLFWPLTPEAEEPEWHITTDIGCEIVIGANCGRAECSTAA